MIYALPSSKRLMLPQPFYTLNIWWPAQICCKKWTGQTHKLIKTKDLSWVGLTAQFSVNIIICASWKKKPGGLSRCGSWRNKSEWSKTGCKIQLDRRNPSCFRCAEDTRGKLPMWSLLRLCLYSVQGPLGSSWDLLLFFSYENYWFRNRPPFWIPVVFGKMRVNRINK